MIVFVFFLAIFGSFFFLEFIDTGRKEDGFNVHGYVKDIGILFKHVSFLST